VGGVRVGVRGGGCEGGECRGEGVRVCGCVGVGVWVGVCVGVSREMNTQHVTHSVILIWIHFSATSRK